MRKISQKVKNQLLERESKCARADHNCDGRITWEHALTYAGKQIDEAWAIVFLCEYHHAVNKHQDGGDLKKEINVWVALNQATEEELRRHSKAIDYIKLKEKLNNKYGKFNQ
jgi:hypothetical protein